MTYSQPPDEREYRELVAECHSLIAAIAQKPYAVKLLKSVRQALLMHLNYKSRRQRDRTFRH
jgi:hypothetical protein